jgi:chromosome segregation ATPase
MDRNARMILALAGLLFAFVVVRPVHAQAARSSSGNAQMIQQMQQLAAERTRLMADNARLQSELDAARKERDELKKKQGNTDNRLRASDAAAARAERTSTTAQADLEREKARLAELITKFRETAGTLRDVETDRTAVKSALAQRDTELKQCVVRNQALYSLNGEILTKLESRGSFTPASALEPFTRLKRVELENLIDGYQTRADEQRPPTAANK